ncbi:MAG: ABC transporter permease subunit [Oscillospiraceae bacterium]|nr:ABC transporter permease subunit [Oscillospiraceae bacterium]
MRAWPKTLTNIIIYVGVSVAVIIITLSTLLYRMVDKQGLILVQQTNQQLLDEVSFHLSYVNQVATSFCSMQMYDSDVQSLLTADTEDNPILEQQLMRRMNKLILTNEMLESVFLYNGQKKLLYSTLSIATQEYKDIYKILNSNVDSSSLIILPRPVFNEVTGEYDHTVLSYIMFVRDVFSNDVLSAVVVNVKTSWMAANLSTTPIQYNNKSHIIIVQGNGRILLDTQETVVRLSDVYLDNNMFLQAKSLSGTFHTTRQGIKQVVSSTDVLGTDWIVISIQPYSVLHSFTSQLLNGTLLIIIFSFLLAAPLSFCIAQLIYKPYRTLITHISAHDDEKEKKSINEFDYLMDVFDSQTIAWNILLLRSFFNSVPNDIIEAARIDGAGEMRTFLQIVLPLSKPGLASVGFLIILRYWNDWWLSMLYIQTSSRQSLQYKLYTLMKGIEELAKDAMVSGTVDVVNFPSESARMAMAFLSIAPILFLFPFFQKYLVKGITVGAVKG